MRHLMLIVGLALHVSTVDGQSNRLFFYKAAYDSIICTREFSQFTGGRKVNVSSQIIPFSVMGLTFVQELSRYGLGIRSDTIKSSDYHYSKDMKKLFRAKRSAKINMFFSEMVDGFLLVAIKRSQRRTNRYQYATQYGEGLCYLLQFSESGSIEFLKVASVHHN